MSDLGRDYPTRAARLEMHLAELVVSRHRAVSALWLAKTSTTRRSGPKADALDACFGVPIRHVSPERDTSANDPVRP